jgi:hypothetical protein
VLDVVKADVVEVVVVESDLEEIVVVVDETHTSHWSPVPCVRG